VALDYEQGRKWYTVVADVFRVLHTSDWHLGKSLHGQDRYEEHECFFAFLLNIIKEKEINALIVVGDIFDSTSPSQSALRLYYSFIAKVYHTTTCAIVIISGNHDSPAQLDAPKNALKALNTHIVGALPLNLKEALVLLPSAEKPQLIIAALPFLRDTDLRTGHLGQPEDEIRKTRQEGIRKKYQDIGDMAQAYQTEGVALLATGHLTVVGASKSESERDTIHIGGLSFVPTDIFPDLFSYVALGHLHRSQKVDSQEHIRYSGSPIPFSFSESLDTKEIRFLEFSNGMLSMNYALEVPVARRLFQINTCQKELEATLNDFQPTPSELLHWVELIITDDDSASNIQETIERITAGKSFKVIKTIIENNSPSDGLRAHECSSRHSLEDLLGNPQEVFIQRLDQEKTLNTEERESLLTAFQELYDLVLETQRHCLTPQESTKIM
jgi:exonuclease SbcD